MTSSTLPAQHTTSPALPSQHATPPALPSQHATFVTPPLRLKLLLPTEVLIEQVIQKLIAESPHGSFCLRPRHQDWVTALVPGLLSFVDLQGQEHFVAVDEGHLVKCGDQVLVSCGRASISPSLGQVRQTVEQEFLQRDAREERAHAVLMRLEALFVQRFAKI